MKILLTVSYDGTNYAGWQRQKNAYTVQEALENALSRVFGQNVTVIGAGRTDAGVHALAQKAMVTQCVDTKIPLEKIPYVINSFIGDDIRVAQAEAVPDGFHPLVHAVKKTYEYKIFSARFMNPLLRNYAYFTSRPLDIENMRQACAFFLGEHDFKAFYASGGHVKTTLRTIYDMKISEADGLVTISITGNGFLYNMVRIIAGTVLMVGEGKFKPEEVAAIIASCDRTRAGVTLPAAGLTMTDVVFDMNCGENCSFEQ